jgi:Lamin Tail Domain
MRLRERAVTATVLAVSGVLVLGMAPAQAAPVIRITKIHYGQVGNNLNTEYIVLKNTTSSTISIKGWKIVSAPSSDNQHYVFPRTRVHAGKTVVLYTGSGTNSPGKRYWGATSSRWDNDGDKAVLRSASGTVVDSCQYIGGGTVKYC